MKSVIVLVLLAVVGWFGLEKYQDRLHAQREAEYASQPFKKKQPLPAARSNEPAVSFFSCDPSRTTCKQMTSCEEARYYIKTCPGFNSGVFGEEASCERQWCKK